MPSAFCLEGLPDGPVQETVRAVLSGTPGWSETTEGAVNVADAGFINIVPVIRFSTLKTELTEPVRTRGCTHA